MLASQSIQIYQKALAYSNKNEAAAFAFTCEVEAFIDDTFTDTKCVYASKENTRNIHYEITDLRIKIAEAKADTIKLMFVLFMAQIGFVLAIIFLFIKK